jgi:dTDP-4-amino-4,6-dideoxygalactose transaminase
MNAIMEIGREHQIPIIEDAAHAPGATWSGRSCGTIGDVGCFSFFSNKNLVCGEGGAVVTNDDHIAEAVRLMRSHGMTALTYDRHQGRAQSYDVTCLGYNYRPTEITAALALAQLDKLAANNQRRQELTRLYWQQLDTAPLTLPFRGQEHQSSCHLMPVLLPRELDRSQVMWGLREAGIQSSIHYPAVHRFTVFSSDLQPPLPRTEEAADRVLTLPLHPLLADRDIVAVSTVLLDVIAQVSDRETDYCKSVKMP